ncbi:hypothetical protein FALCPG4_000451 [Fusarium falciforme]
MSDDTRKKKKKEKKRIESGKYSSSTRMSCKKKVTKAVPIALTDGWVRKSNKSTLNQKKQASKQANKQASKQASKQSSITRSGSARGLAPRSNARPDQTLSYKTNKQTIGTRSHRGHRREGGVDLRTTERKKKKVG